MFLKNSKGFTLVEIMIALAILGILSTIAIPSYMRYTRTAAQAEAKTALSSIFSAQEMFHSEWECYAGMFAAIGYQPKGNFKYVIGVNTALSPICGNGTDDLLSASARTTVGQGPLTGRTYRGPTGADASHSNTFSYCDSINECTYIGNKDITNASNHVDQDNLLNSTTAVINPASPGSLAQTNNTEVNTRIERSASVDTFVEGAVANLRHLNEDFDIWAIDQNKTLVNVNDGTD